MATIRVRQFLWEARRRQVYRAAGLYIVGAWVALQVAALAFPGLGIDDSAIRFVWIGAALGLPVALILAWRYDIAGGKIVRTTETSDGSDLSIGFADYSILASLAIVVIVSTSGLVHRINLTRTESSTSAITAPVLDARSIAVLPFTNMSSSADSTYFAHGITEELLNLLTRIPDLHVSSRTSSFHYAGKDIPLKLIASELGVRHVLEGSVRRDRDHVRVTAQLIDAVTDTHLWSNTYDREMIDLFAVQDDIASAITRELQLSLSDTMKREQPTANSEAYDQYLRGLYFLRLTPTPGNVLKAHDLFRSAIQADPEYADAHAGLALALITMGNFRLREPALMFPQARESALTAAALDERLSYAQIALGWVAISYDWDWAAAETHFRHAIELAPGDSFGHHSLAWPLQITGRYDEAMETAQKAFAMDPLSAWTRSTVLEVAFKAGDLDTAIQQIHRMLEVAPDDALSYAALGIVHVRKGQPDEGLRYAHKVMSLAPDSINDQLGAALIFALAGEDQKALDIVKRAEAMADDQFVSPGAIAVVYANLGETDLAIAWLEHAIEVYDSMVFNLDYPDWDPIRSDPRFVAICERLNMACALR